MISFTRRMFSASLLAGLSMAAACSDDNGTDPQPTAPAAPTNVVAASQSATSIQVTWTASAGATSYVIQRALGAAGTFADAGTSTTPTFTDNGLAVTTLYRYRVAAVNAVGQSSFSGESNATTGAPAPIDVTQDITTNTTWTSDNIYVLKGFIKVANGATLTVQAGTRIEGDFATLGASLFVLRGARIVANGTAEAPIVFTSSRPVGQRQPGDWGGLIIVGNARINRTGNIALEGTGTNEATNPAVVYSGGTNDLDNSGVLRYVRVEFAGYATAQDQELNSFTFAAVGSGTQMEYLQALAGLDDHFEWFGGTADAKYLVSYESADDHFDMSEGFSGRLQHLIAFQSRIIPPRPAAGSPSSDPQGIENDGCNGPGCTAGEVSEPFTIPLVANFTLVGTGPGVVPNATSGIGMMLRRGTGGYYINGHVSRFPNGAIALRNTVTSGAVSSTATGDRVADGTLVLRNILATDGAVLFEAGQGRVSIDPAANAITHEAATATSSLFTAWTALPNATAQLDWSPSASAPQRTGGLSTFSGAIAAKAGSAVTPTTYRGAADPNGAKWWAGWTNYATN